MPIVVLTSGEYDAHTIDGVYETDRTPEYLAVARTAWLALLGSPRHEYKNAADLMARLGTWEQKRNALYEQFAGPREAYENISAWETTAFTEYCNRKHSANLTPRQKWFEVNLP